MSKVITFKMLEEEQFNKIHISPGTLISGKIVDINGDYAIIDAGLKSECRVPVKQFISDQGENNANIGDEYEFLLETIDEIDITILVSHSSDLIRAVCDRGIYLKDGRVEYDGEVNSALEFYSKYS